MTMAELEIMSVDPFWQNDARFEEVESEVAQELAHENPHGSLEPSPAEIQAFKAYCNLAVSCSPDGKDCSLTVSADANGRTYSKTIDLAPIVEFFARKMREYHLRLHGSDPAVSGWRDWISKAGKVAQRIATNEAVSTVFKEVAKSAIPGLSLAMKAHDVLVKANDGDPKAMAKLAAIKTLATQGDPKANEALSTLRVMNEAIKVKAEKEESAKTIPDRYGGAPLEVMGTGLYGLGVATEVGARARTRSRGKPIVPSRGKRSGRRSVPPSRSRPGQRAQANTWQQATPGTEPMGPLDPLDPNDPYASQYPYDPYGPYGDPYGGFPSAPGYPYPGTLPPPSFPYGSASSLPPQLQAAFNPYGSYGGPSYEPSFYDPGYEDFDPDMYEEASDDVSAAVSGWLFNRPYRGVLAAATSPFPGVGIASRAMYNKGMETKTKTEDKYTAFFRKILKV